MLRPRTLPSNPEAEQSVIGGLLFDGRAFDRVGGIVGPVDFHDARYEATYDAIREIAGRQGRIDALTVAAEMKRLGTMARLANSGAEGFLFELANSVCTTEGIVAHAQMVRGKSYLRRLIIEAGNVADRAYRDEESAEAIIEAAQANILGLADVSPKKEPVHIREITHGAVCELQRRQDNPSAISGVPSGIDDLDEMLGGAQPGHLDVVAGRPGIGKTAFVLSWILNATERNFPCLMFSIEMPKEELGMRAISGAGQVDNGAMKSGLMTALDWFHINNAAGRLAKTPLWIDDDGAQDLFSICAKARRWRQRKDVFPTGNEKGMVIVDYLQLIAATRQKGQFQSREREVAETSSKLKALAKQLGLPVLALSSLNRKCEDRPDKRPQMSDLKESGAIESDADVVMLLYRDEVYNKEPKAADKHSPAKPNKGIAEICVAKHRGGQTGTIECQYQKEYTLFRNLSNRSGY